MIKSTKTVLAASTALALLSAPAMAANGTHAPLMQLAQAEVPPTDPVAAAEAAVEEARAALRAAMASGRGVEEARRNLRAALQALDEARKAAGQTAPDTEEQQPPEQAPPEQPPQQQQQEQPQPPPPQQPPQQPPPQDQQQPPPPPSQQEQVPSVDEVTPPPQEQPPTPRLRKQQQDQQQQQQEQQPPPQQPQQQPPPPPSQQQQQQQPSAPPKIELPPPSNAEPPPPPPPPPPEATQGQFDLKKFKVRPKFGQATEPESKTPPPQLQQSEDAVKEGAVIKAPEGRVIVKDNGQVMIHHNDVDRLRQQGDKVETQKEGDDIQKTIVARPDGTKVVTVRDDNGNIIQRYREKPDGTVEVIIGQTEDPGFLGRVFGKGPQMAPPRAHRPPERHFNFGPLQVTIPRDQYIVESSRASEQDLQRALSAPPVEQVERPYTLEEIRQSGRLRDKVRRIDFDTITFDTNQATVADSQIPTLQSIGTAIRSIIDRDPTQVFLVEGHTDAVGSDLYNLALSDRRAETVAEILTYYYGIPPENLITQGYGEQFLKIPTVAPERENRRVAFRNITPLLRAANQ